MARNTFTMLDFHHLRRLIRTHHPNVATRVRKIDGQLRHYAVDASGKQIGDEGVNATEALRSAAKVLGLATEA